MPNDIFRHLKEFSCISGHPNAPRNNANDSGHTSCKKVPPTQRKKAAEAPALHLSAWAARSDGRDPQEINPATRKSTEYYAGFKTVKRNLHVYGS